MGVCDSLRCPPEVEANHAKPEIALSTDPVRNAISDVGHVLPKSGHEEEPSQ
jgi:hypothetical protein